MITFVDLFCGGGFGARGAVTAGAQPLLAVDAWNLATDTYKSNFPSAEVLCSPIEEIDPFELAQRFKPDVLLTSPECTSHSIARGAKPGCEQSKEGAGTVLEAPDTHGSSFCPLNIIKGQVPTPESLWADATFHTILAPQKS